ncbi:CheR family methyltransferase [Stigmatella aurantiaca]|uniref:protein-glutamate O-methyltransferase n=1 Tax=Stigmatella aurantiaca (strain DW4/3-1) TaxID=378806 RepID=Q08UH1_STIAD|nr:protein-glutamate O-methyltransferase CheR [Stigmatella aurantiaca]ADO73368.1 Chemotaxis protein methyltransferase CheR [Stigmatella aurantiaca DW4/3-1]EAU64136.1 CheR methyltransferase, SAM binding domain [Stigmatella aurantiaca DW4/3-1]
MTAEEFRLLRDHVYAHCGILMREDMKFVMERRLWPRLEALGISDFSAYHRYLRYDAQRRAELEAAVEALTTHETYFFREMAQLNAFTEELLPLLQQRNASVRRLRIWSAGCSTGEEAYTIAMLLRDSRRFEGWDVEVYGTDISRRVLTTARRAEYGPSSLRTTPPEMVSRFFVPLAGNKVRVRDEVRAWVSFGHLNLLDEESYQLVPRMDVIFCRNVMIYFDLPARRRLLRIFNERLVPGGYLMLGHSENLLNLGADFELVHLRGDLAYRRPMLPSKVGG